jgi:hypothetical protein
MKTLFAASLSLTVFSTAFAQRSDKPNKYPWEIKDQVYTSDSTGVSG